MTPTDDRAGPPKGWQPIDTAPTNRVNVLLGWYDPAGLWQWTRGRFWPLTGLWYESSVTDEQVRHIPRPTHWQPAPQSPHASPAPTPAEDRAGWRSAETPPPLHTGFVQVVVDGRVDVASFNANGWKDGEEFYIKPTLWKPLDALPGAEDRAGGGAEAPKSLDERASCLMVQAWQQVAVAMALGAGYPRTAAAREELNRICRRLEMRWQATENSSLPWSADDEAAAARDWRICGASYVEARAAAVESGEITAMVWEFTPGYHALIEDGHFSLRVINDDGVWHFTGTGRRAQAPGRAGGSGMTATPDTGAGRDWAGDAAGRESRPPPRESLSRHRCRDCGGQLVVGEGISSAGWFCMDCEKFPASLATPPRDDGGAGRDLEEGK